MTELIILDKQKRPKRFGSYDFFCSGVGHQSNVEPIASSGQGGIGGIQQSGMGYCSGGGGGWGGGTGYATKQSKSGGSSQDEYRVHLTAMTTTESAETEHENVYTEPPAYSQGFVKKESGQNIKAFIFFT